MNKLNQINPLPSSTTRRSQRRKNKIKAKIQSEYAIPNPYKNPNSIKDFPQRLGKQLTKFDKLSLKSLQKIDFIINQQKTRERIPSCNQITLDGRQQFILDDQTLCKMRCAANKQQNKFIQLVNFLQLHDLDSNPNTNKISYIQNKQGKQIQYQAQQENLMNKFDHYDHKINDNHEQYSEDVGNMFHQPNNSRFLLYSDRHLSDNFIVHNFMKEDLDHYLI